MKSVVIHTEGDVRIEDTPMPLITADDDVLVKVFCSGLCGSDIPRVFAHGAHYYPITLGHEFSGHVVEYGGAVTDLNVGDAIACVPLLPCFDCPECRREYFSLCKKYDFIGSRRNGGHAQYVVVKRANLFLLPSGMKLEDGAFIEPVTVGLHAYHLAGGCEGKNVVVIGAGTIGLLAIQCAVALGAKSVVAVDIAEDKLKLAAECGATLTLNSREMSTHAIDKALEDRRFDQLVLETAGVGQTVSLALEIAGPRAQVALIGTLHNDLTLTQAVFGQILRKELTLLGSWMNYSGPWPGQEWQTAVELLKQQKIRLHSLIASQEGPEEFARAVMALQGRPMQGKILLRWD